MSSTNDSDVTYCSEVEKLIKATCFHKKSDQNVAIRRSQRLLQKFKLIGTKNRMKEKKIPCSGSTDIANKHANNLNRSEIKDHQVLLYPEFICKHDVYSVNDSLKMLRNDVPLDLSHKFKVLPKQTSKRDLDILKDSHDLKIDKVKSVMKKARETTKGNIKQKKKRGRSKKVRIEETCLIDNTKSLKLDRELESHMFLVETLPLDLSHKSKVSTKQTSERKLDILKMPHDLKMDKVKSVMEKARETTKGHIKQKKKQGRPKKVLSNEKCLIDNSKSSILDRDLESHMFSLENLSKTEKNKNELQDHVKVKKLHIAHSTSTVPLKITNSKQFPYSTINFSSKKLEIIKPTTQKLCNKYEEPSNNRNSKMNQSKTLTLDNDAENFNTVSNLKLELQNTTDSNSKIPLSKTLKKSSKCLKRCYEKLVSNKNVQLESKNSNTVRRKRNKIFENVNLIESQNKKLPPKSLKRSCGTIISDKSILEDCQNSNSICRKRTKFLNENNERNDMKISTNVRENSLETLSRNKPVPISQDIFENFSNETQTIKRSQKTILCDKRNVGEYSSNELQNFIRYIKSEQLIPFDIYPKTIDESNPRKDIPKTSTQISNTKVFTEDLEANNNGQNKSTQIKTEILSSLDNRPTNSGEKKLSKRSQDLITDNKNNTFLEENVESLQNVVTKNLESKEIAKKSNKKDRNQNSQHSYFTRSNYNLKTEKIKTNELKNYSESVKSNFKTHNKEKALNTGTASEKTPKKSKVETEKPPLNKNYLKTFDKIQDKIHTTTAINNHYEKTKHFQIPPTPANSTQELGKKSLLPEYYPPHFKYQLPPEAVLTRTSNEIFEPINVITPDDTPASELLQSCSSSPSLPESLCELFQTKHIKDILNVDKVSYRLYNYHVQALALTLNLSLEYLLKILDKIMKIQPKVLKNIDKAVKMPFVQDYDLFATTPEEQSWASGEVVFNSQNSKKQRMSVIGGRI